MVRFAAHVVRGNLRLLLGMIRANHPTRVMARLSRSATAALGTGAYAISSASLWTVADQSSWPRLLAVALMSVLLILVALVIAHGLWERASTPAAREQVTLFNVVTITTLGIGVATLYAALFVLMTLAAAVVDPTLELREGDRTRRERARLCAAGLVRRLGRHSRRRLRLTAGEQRRRPRGHVPAQYDRR